jgi:predicted transcriptional regulator
MTDKKPPSKQRHYNRSAKSEQEHLERLERQQEALRLRLLGLTYRQIASELGITSGTVSRYLQDAREQLVKEMIIPCGKEVLAMELAKLDMAEREVWRTMKKYHVAYTNSGKIVIDTDEKGKPYKIEDWNAVMSAVGRLLSILDRRSKYLGLDQPTKIEQSGSVEVTTIQHPDLSVLTDEEYTAWKAANAKLRASMEDTAHGTKDHDDA